MKVIGILLFFLLFLSSLEAENNMECQYVGDSLKQDSILLTQGQLEYERMLHYASEFTLLKNTGHNFPIKDLVSDSIIFVAFNHLKEWRDYVWRYNNNEVLDGTIGRTLEYLKDSSYSNIILMLDSIERIDSAFFSGIDVNKFSLVFFGDPGEILNTQGLFDVSDILITYEDNEISRDLAVQFAFGAIGVNGRIKEPIGEYYKPGDGITVTPLGRLKYTHAESVGVNGDTVEYKVDSVVNNAVVAGAFPGCRVLVAVKGNVIFNKSYGFHTYDDRIKVQQHDVYDLASVTKVTGTLPLIMKAYDEGLMELDKPFSDYWEDWDNGLFHRSDKDKITVREVLAHQAGLKPYINYFTQTLKDGNYKSKWYNINPTDEYSVNIDQHLFLSHKFREKIYKDIRRSPLLEEKEYKYSGLSFIIYPEMLSRLFKEPYEDMLYNEFCKPLGASSLKYNPMGKVVESRIVPTEYDHDYRKVQVKGRVHDQAAAVMGGVSGNAGLFATADDLAKMMQMYLQKGTYAGVKYISEETMDEFTKVQFPDNENRRGAGFDKPLFGNDTLSITDSYPAPAVSPKSYGHSGFTGTFVWIDPEYDMIYIFLSNRVYPTRDNRLIYEMNVRPTIQQIFYDELERVRDK